MTDLPPPTSVPYGIRTERLLLRCYEPRDAEQLEQAVTSSLDELRPWMPWAHVEPIDRDERVDFLRKRRADFDCDREYFYGAFEGEELVGACGLHRRVGPAALEVGYWTPTAHTGRGIATEGAGALVRVAFEVHGVERVDLQCEPGNEASARIAGKLGFREEAVLPRRFQKYDGSLRDIRVFSLHRPDYGESPCARQELELLGASGQRIFL